MIDRRKAYSLVALVVLLCSGFSFYAGATGMFPRLNEVVDRNTAVMTKQATPAAAGGLDLNKLKMVQDTINQEYLNPVTADQLTVGALRGMVAATGDKYSVYYTPEEYKRFEQQFDASLSGIGVYVEISPKTNMVTVVSPMKGSPGEQAGLKAGDTILAVDGTDIHDYTLDKAVEMIRGKAGTKVTLTIQRQGENRALQFTITRATIDLPTVDSKMLEPGVGYIQLMQFNDKVSDKVAKAIADLRSQGMTRLVLDLRQDPGGLLTEAINTASLFVPEKQPVLYVEGKDGKRVTYVSHGAATKFDLPLVVLVDGGTASAAEILSGALKDDHLGVLMGAKTFGKGSVQNFQQFEDGSGIKLTTAHYLTAGGVAINGVGIMPDVQLKDNPADVLPGDAGDVQLQEAVKYIKGMNR
ncbi:MAG: S41 family peptidase [Mycobacterium leprae]